MENDIDLVEGFMEWLATLTPEFAFLLALPFAVAVAGLARYALQRERRPRPAAGPRRHAPQRRWSRVH